MWCGEIRMYVKRNTFTLIELLVVISIIGILTSILMPSLATARDKAKKAVCTSNIKQAGVAMYSYAGDDDSYLMLNLFVNTLAGRVIYDNSTYKGRFYGGSQGYLHPYLGDEKWAYNCPGSEHVADFGDRDRFTSIPGVYTGFTNFNFMTRRIDNNHINGPGQDRRRGWDTFNMTPLLMDPVMDMTRWGGTWVNTESVIHGNKGALPILILDGRVHQFQRSRYPAIWPHQPWNYEYIMDNLLQQIN